MLFLMLKFNVPIKIPVVFDNGLNYDCHFIMKELANDFSGNLNVLEKILKNTKPFLFQ